ncbi:MAG: hypothetical protein IPP90_15040 [Gemmatimonadaceae bacterium]|nr:hypothetical protein [Gemmatimonadaceae bacterium]
MRFLVDQFCGNLREGPSVAPFTGRARKATVQLLHRAVVAGDQKMACRPQQGIGIRDVRARVVFADGAVGRTLLLDGQRRSRRCGDFVVRGAPSSPALVTNP